MSRKHVEASFSNLSDKERDMTKDEFKMEVTEDIAYFRSKAKYYKSHRLDEAAYYAEKLASNLELALTTLPSDNDIKIA